MNDFLWIVFLLAWLIFLFLRTIDWLRGKRPFWDKINHQPPRVVPMIPGVGPVHDKFVDEEESRQRRKLD